MAIDGPLVYQSDVTGIEWPLVDEKPPKEDVCSSARRVRPRTQRTGLPAGQLQIEGSKSNLPPNSKMTGANFSLCSQEAGE